MTPTQPIEPFRKRVQAFARELSGVERGSVQALHRARVASRRLRELVPLLMLDRPTALKLKRRLREVTRELGTVRELDVLAVLIDELRRNARYRPVGLDRLAAEVKGARETARERLSEALSSSKLRRLADRLERAHNGRVNADRATVTPKVNRSNRTWVWALEARMIQRANRLRLAIDLAGTIYTADRLHDVRVALKKVRYAAELLHEADAMDHLSDLDALKALQDLLGRMHDFDVLMAWGRKAQASLAPADSETRRELNLLLLGLEDDCRRMHGRYMGSRAALVAIIARLHVATSRKSTAQRGSRVSSPKSQARRGGPRSGRGI